MNRKKNGRERNNSDVAIVMYEFKMDALKMFKQPQQSLVQEYFKTHPETWEFS